LKRDECLKVAQSLREEGRGTDEVLSGLRAIGAEPLDCVIVLREVDGISLALAKELVDGSRVWADRRSANELLRRQALEVLLDETPED
jgi:hypothetical protein